MNSVPTMNWSALLSVRRETIIDRNNVIAKTAKSNNSKTINTGYKKRAIVSNCPLQD